MQSGKIIDIVLGTAVIGAAGATVGYFLGRPVAIMVGIIFGGLIGGVVGGLGGRRFFISILCGAAVGSLLATRISGADMAFFGAAYGAAVGGFVGVTLGLFFGKSEQLK